MGGAKIKREEQEETNQCSTNGLKNIQLRGVESFMCLLPFI